MKDYLVTQEGRNLPVPHCIKGTSGWELIPELQRSAQNYVILEKPTAMLLKAALPEAKICVDASCCAGVTLQSHKNALEAMKMCQIEIK